MFNLMHLESGIQNSNFIRSQRLGIFVSVEFARRQTSSTWRRAALDYKPEKTFSFQLVWAKDSGSRTGRDANALTGRPSMDRAYTQQWADRLDVAIEIMEIIR